MFNFKSNSEWSLENELRCFVIFKQLEDKNFPRGMQSQLCRGLEEESSLSFNTINAKVGNFKSVAGAIGDSHASEATRFLVQKYGHLSLAESEALLEGYLLCLDAHE